MKHFLTTVSRTAVRDIIDFIYPPRCLVCQRRNPEYLQCIAPYTPCPYLCSTCQPSLPQAFSSWIPPKGIGCNITRCPCCREPGPTNDICIACKVLLAPTSVLDSVWIYEGPAEQVIKTYKYGHQRPLADYFAQQLATVIRKHLSGEGKTAIVAVPSSRSAIRRRGFSHMALIAQRLSRLLEIPFFPQALRCSKQQRPAQVALRLAERYRYLRTAFAAGTQDIVGREIILIDDVLTSGASLFSAAEVLRTSGAERITGVTLARSPRFKRNRVVAGICS